MEADIPLWVTILGVFLATAAVFILAVWDIVYDWISDSIKGLLGRNKR